MFKTNEIKENKSHFIGKSIYRTFVSFVQAVGRFILAVFDTIDFIFSRLYIRHLFLSLTAYFAPSYETEDTDIFSDDDISDFFGDHRGGNKFLNKYSEKDATTILRLSPLCTKLDALVPDWYVEFDLSDCFSHYGYIRSRSITEKEKYYAFIIVHVGDFSIEKPFLEGRGPEIIRNNFPHHVNFLNIKWFSLQDPTIDFTEDRPRLPGQKYPGTRMGRLALSLLTTLAFKNGRDGIVNNPEHFHNAYLYEGFLFLNATQQGWFQRLVSDLSEDIKEKGLATVSWSIYLGFGREKGKKFEWNLKEQVLPLSLRMTRYFHKREYRKEVENAARESGPFAIDWAAAKNSAMSTCIKSE